MAAYGTDYCVTTWWCYQTETFSALVAFFCGEFTGYRWIPRTKASDVELWCYLWFASWINGWINNREARDLRRHRAHYDVIVMKSPGKVLAMQYKLVIFLHEHHFKHHVGVDKWLECSFDYFEKELNKTSVKSIIRLTSAHYNCEVINMPGRNQHIMKLYVLVLHEAICYLIHQWFVTRLIFTWIDFPYTI